MDYLLQLTWRRLAAWFTLNNGDDIQTEFLGKIWEGLMEGNNILVWHRIQGIVHFLFQGLQLLDIGIGIGLFGIFSIMRYRTDAMPVREMTYLFTIICMSVVNALGSTISFAEQLIPNFIILLAIGLCEGLLLNGKEMSKLVQYDRIELIKPEHHDELLADLKGRTGLEITRVDIGSIDFLRDMAMLKIYYKNPGVGASDDAVNHQSKITRQEWEDVNGL